MHILRSLNMAAMADRVTAAFDMLIEVHRCWRTVFRCLKLLTEHLLLMILFSRDCIKLIKQKYLTALKVSLQRQSKCDKLRKHIKRRIVPASFLESLISSAFLFPSFGNVFSLEFPPSLRHVFSAGPIFAVGYPQRSNISEDIWLRSREKTVIRQFMDGGMKSCWDLAHVIWCIAILSTHGLVCRWVHFGVSVASDWEVRFYLKFGVETVAVEVLAPSYGQLPALH